MPLFALPDPGEGLVEAELVSWRVAVGDEIKINDVVVEVETSKSLVELPSPYAGTVRALLVEEGSTVDVGTPILDVDDGTEADEAPGPNLVGYGATEGATSRRPRRPREDDPASAEVGEQVQQVFDTSVAVGRKVEEQTPLAPVAAQPSGQPLPAPDSGAAEPAEERGPVLAKPPVRLLAKQRGIDLAALTGTGDGGVITRADVLAVAAAGEPRVTPVVTSSPALAPAEPGTETIVKGVRRATAEAMVASAFTAPHVTEWVEVDVTATMDLLDRIRARREFADLRVTPLTLVALAALKALHRNRDLNARWVDDPQGARIVHPATINLGIAAATPRGLVVPVVRGADQLGLRELAAALAELVATARAGRTQPAELADGTFTITNIGVFGIDGGTPILNPGQSGILCMGAINRRPWVVGSGDQERIEPRWVTTLAVSFDHRVVDGAEGSRFLADVALALSDPALGLAL